MSSQPHNPIVPLGTLLKESPSNGYSPVCPKEPTGKWILGLSALSERSLDLSQAKFAPKNDELVDRFQLQPGDFLISRSNSIEKVGRVGVYRGGLDNCSYSDLMMRFRPDESKVWPEYLEVYLRSDAAVKYIQRHATGTSGSMKKINQAVVESIPIILLCLDDQKNTAMLLTAWESCIDKMEKLISVKRNNYLDFRYKLLFGKARLGGRITKGILAKPWYSVPNDWLIVTVGTIAKEVSTKNLNSDNIPVLSCTKYQGLVDSLKYFDKQIFSKDTSTYKVVEYGQFAYATNHIEEGSIGYQNLYPNGLVSPMYTVFKTDQKLIDDGYLYKLLKTETYRHIFQVNTSASVDRRGSLRWHEFSKLPLPLPSLNEQKEINEVLEIAQKEIDLLTRKIDLLKKQKSALMQKLLTGEWRVKTAGEVS